MLKCSGALAFALLLSGLVAGCSDSGTAKNDEVLSAEEVAARYGYEPASATLTPVFALVPQYKDPRDGYARDLLAERCLEGVVQYNAVDPSAEESLIDRRTHQLQFDEEIAQQWGYPVLRLPVTADSAVPDDVEITTEIHEKMVACGQKADERLGVVPERLLSGIESAGWNAVAGDDRVEDASEAWVSCMAPVGVIDLPDTPDQMPSASVVKPPVDSAGNIIDAQVALSEREREVAVADARCRVESGYTAAVLQARVDAELAAIGRDPEGFEASRHDYEEYAAGIDEVVAELG